MPAQPASAFRRHLGPVALAASLALAACGDMSATEQRTLSGAGLGAAGGALIGSITGDAGWGALIGAGVGATGGYLYDRTKKNEDAAYRRGLQDGRRRR